MPNGRTAERLPGEVLVVRGPAYPPHLFLLKPVHSLEQISLERQQELLEEYKEEAMEAENIDTILWEFGDYDPDPPETGSSLVYGDDDDDGNDDDDDDGVGEAEEDEACLTELAWHPYYAAGWKNGFCQYTRTCDSPSYSSLLECCQKVRTIDSRRLLSGVSYLSFL